MWKHFLLVVTAPIILMAATGPALADWPMTAANPQRTSWVSEEVTGNLDIEWACPVEAYITEGVHLVATNNRIYVSSSRGLYVLNAVNGSEVWRLDTQIPLGNAPTVDNGVVYVPGLDRRIYALDDSDGSVIWMFEDSSAGYSSNPLVINGVVYAGCRDGYFYAINASTGNMVWRYPDIGQDPIGPIIESAAYENGVIYFAANDCFAYALNASDGSLLWKSAKLPGHHYQSFWPVIYRDKVVFSVIPGYKPGNPGTNAIQNSVGQSDDSYNKLEKLALWPGSDQYEYIGPTVSISDPWTHGNTVRDASLICEHYEDNPDGHIDLHKPWRRLSIILDLDDGTEYTMDTDGDGYPSYCPVGYYGKRSQMYPPIIGINDDVYYQLSLIARTAGYGMTRGQVFGWNMGTPYVSINGIQTAGDEPEAISGGGSIIYQVLCCCREGSWDDLDGGSGFLWTYSNPIMDLLDNPNDSPQLPGLDVMWWGRSSLSGLQGNFGNHNGIYHDHGDQNPLIPYNGRLYVHRSNAVVCYGPGTQASSPLPILAMDDNKVDTLPAPTVTELRAKLAEEIQKMIDAGNLKPGWYNPGQWHHTALMPHFVWPTDTLLVLCRAYNHISDPMLKADLEIYIMNQWNQYFYPTMYGAKGWSEGVSRDWMEYPPEISQQMTTFNKAINASGRCSFNYPPHGHYAIYKFAEIFPTYALEAYNQAKGRLQVPVPQTDDYITGTYGYEINMYITGYIGFLALQEEAGMEVTDASLRTQVQNELDRLLALKINGFTKDSYFTTPDQTLPDGQYRGRRMNVSMNWMFMCPELAVHMRQNLLTEVEEAIKEYNWVGPYWFVSRYNGTVSEGATSCLYHVEPMFEAKAWILQEPYEELVKYLDVSAFKTGDLFYINTLLSTIEAGSGGNQAPYVNVGSNQQITLPDDDVNLDGTVNDDGLPDPPATVTVTWTKDSGPGTVTFGNDNAVDTSATFSTDGVYVLRLTADDSELTNYDTVQITVNPTATNQAPSVDAGSNQQITLPTDTVSLDGTVNDDGLPNPPGAVTQTWTKQSGSGSVTFANANAVDTTATFSEIDTYVLRLTADDSELSDYDEVTITVNPVTGGLTATAGADPNSGTAPLEVQFTGSASGGQGGGEVTGIIDNPDFEDNGGSLDGWTYLSMATLSSPGEGYGGGYAAKLLIDPTGNGIISQQITTELTPDVEYTFTVKVRVVSVGDGWTNFTGFRLGRYDNLDKYWETTEINLSDPDWQTLSCTHTWSATDLDGGGPYPDGHFVHVGVRLNRWDATTPTEVLIDDLTMSTGAGGPTYTYNWDFDNGDDSQDQNPLYTFNNPGTYNVELAVSDGYDIAYDYVTINVSPPADTDPPTPDPLTWVTLPHSTGTTSISMTATTASDPSGLEYYFDSTTLGGNDSGWQDGTTYEDTALTPSTQYTYRVQARDKSANQNSGGWSTAESATTDTPPDTTPPTPDPLTWATLPHSTGTTSISMTATTASDPSGVEYYFDCTAGGGNDSGWQDSSTYEDTGLTPDTQYTYRVQARDKSANQNAGSWSTSESATTDPAAGGLTAMADANPTSGTAPLQVQFTGAASGGQGGGEVTGIIDNPDLEDSGGSLDGWTYLTNATLSAAGQGYGGGYAARLFINPTGNGIISQEITTELTPDVEYTFSVKVKVVSLGDGWTNSNGFRLGRYDNVDKYWDIVAIDLTDPNWQTLTLTHTWSATDLDGGGTYPDGHFVHVGIRLSRWNATTPTEILIDDFTMSTGSGGPTYTYDWDFDNGDDSQDQNPLYTFNDPGTYDVELAVSDGYDVAYDYVTVNVSPPADTDPPTPDPLTWATAPYSTGTSSISMTATSASDPSGVEYYFDCTLGGGNDSGWQDSATYEDTGLSPGTQYTYRVQARDKSANQNATEWSSAMAATTDSGIDPNLVAWWEMENNADDSAGTHDGTVSGPTFISDNGYCLECDGGANDRVTIASSTDFDGPTGTWMLWLRTDGAWGVDGTSGGTSVRGNCAVMTRHNATSSFWGLTVMITSTGTIKLQSKNAATLTNVESTNTVTDDAWHHIAVTWDLVSGGDMKVFIDGSPDGSATNSESWSFSSQDLLLGDSDDIWWEEYSGRMDDVRVYDHELQQSEINAIYQQGR